MSQIIDVKITPKSAKPTKSFSTVKNIADPRPSHHGKQVNVVFTKSLAKQVEREYLADKKRVVKEAQQGGFAVFIVILLGLAFIMGAISSSAETAQTGQVNAVAAHEVIE